MIAKLFYTITSPIKFNILAATLAGIKCVSILILFCATLPLNYALVFETCLKLSNLQCKSNFYIIRYFY